MAWLVLLLAGCAHHLGPPPVRYAETPAVLPLVHPTTDGRRWYVPTEAAGADWLLFVDTGYSHTTCDDDLVAALGLRTRGRRSAGGELGRIVTTKAKLPPIQVGDHVLDGLVCLVRDLGTTSSIQDPPEVPVAGVLGMDALRGFRVELDPGAGEVRLGDPDTADPLPEGQHTVRFPRLGPARTRVHVPLRVESAETRPLLDTGAGNTYVDGDRLGLVATRHDERLTLRGSGPGGTKEVTDLRYYDVAHVTFAGHEIRGLTLIDRPHRRTAHGLLGLDVLDRYVVQLDFDARRAHVTPAVLGPPRPTWTEWRDSGIPAPIRIARPD